MRLRNFRPVKALVAAVAALSLLAASAVAGVVTPGNLLVYRVGDGSAALAATATPVFIDEYTTAGTLVQSIAVPTTGTTALTAVGNATTEGIMSISQDGLSVNFTGYRKAAGGANPSSDTPATTNRVIGSIGLSGVVDTSVALTDPTGTIRSASTVNGSTYYIGTSAAVRYVGAPSGAATSTQIDARNSRAVQVADNVLYASNGSTTITPKVQSYGTLPTGATAPTTVVNLGLTDAVNGFFLADTNPSVAGVDTLYALSTVANQLLKYSFNGTTWSAVNSISAATGQNITGFVKGSVVDLYVTTGSSILKLTDSAGSTGNLAGTLTSFVTAGTNTAFRGIAAIPEASAFVFAGLACCASGGIAILRGRRASRQ